MKSRVNNSLRAGALFALYVTSYMPLFLIVIIKQLHDNWEYLHWGGFSKDGIACFVSHFGMSCFLVVISLIGAVGIWVLLHNLKSSLPNGTVVKVTKINNRNSEAVGYIATYIVPFLTSDFSSFFECGIFVIIMALIYVIYINSNMLLINPILSIWFSLLEIEYVVVGDSSVGVHDALVMTDTKDYEENVDYKIYQIGFKLFYGKERDRS